MRREHVVQVTLCHAEDEAMVTLSNSTCPSGETSCEYVPNKYMCCYPGELCIKNEGCTCFSRQVITCSSFDLVLAPIHTVVLIGLHVAYAEPDPGVPVQRYPTGRYSAVLLALAVLLIRSWLA